MAMGSSRGRKAIAVGRAFRDEMNEVATRAIDVATRPHHKDVVTAPLFEIGGERNGV